MAARSSPRTRIAAGIGAAALATTLAACGGSSDTPAAGGNSAAGTPIVVGMTNSNTGAVPYPQPYKGALAAIDYVNKEAGGVNGRPLELEFCSNDGTVNSSKGCAEQLVAAKPVAIIGGDDQGSPGSQPVFDTAKVPLVGGYPLYEVDKTTPYAFRFHNSEHSLAAMARYFVEKNGVKKIGMLYINVPGTVGFLDALTSAVSGYGTEVVKLPTPPTSTDFTPQLTQAQAEGVDAILVVQPSTGASRAMQARTTLGLKMPFGFAEAAISPSTLAAGGAGAEGAYFVSSITPPSQTDDPQVKTFVDAMKKYQPGEPLGTDQEMGFQSVINLVEMLKTLPADGINADAVTAAFKAAKDTPNFLGHPYTCDGKQAGSGQVAICSDVFRVYEYSGGSFTAKSDWVGVVGNTG